MSRPPINRAAPSPRGTGTAPDARYFGPDFAALVALAETLARDRHGIEIPAKGRGLARTLIEIPALFAHILGEHQSLYARESGIASAQLPDSLTRHAARLGYQPDAGVAATGHAAFTAKPGLSGTIPAGFALQSSALGEEKAQTFETLSPVEINADWNALRPADAMIDTPIRGGRGYVTLPLTRPHGLERDEIVLLQAYGLTGIFAVHGTELPRDPPMIALRHLGGESFSGQPPASWGQSQARILARPKVDARLFGWDAPAQLYPATALAIPAPYTSPPLTGTGAAAAGTVALGYAGLAALPQGGLFLDQIIADPGALSDVALVGPGQARHFLLGQVAEAQLRFRRGEVVGVPTLGSPTVTGGPPTVSTQLRLIETEFGKRVSGILLREPVSGSLQSFAALPLGQRVLAGWSRAIAIAPTSPNPALLATDVPIAADLSAMLPGRPLILRRISSGEARDASVASLTGSGATWTLTLAVPGGMPGDWPLSDVEILGNLARVSHGETKAAILGGSDGVTPHQGFAIKEAPVTRLPGALGAEIALEVRVNGVQWDLVADFHDTGPDDRRLRVQTDAGGQVTVLFGGAGRGAIPPSGRRNIDAAFRVGLGQGGNVGPGRLARIRKASPLLDAVTNPLPISGGTDPAGSADIGRQATRPVRVFDRAVSVQDHADLAMLFPGVARASARWIGTGGVELVAADAIGQGVADPTALLAFLNARRDVGTGLILIAPQAVPVTLSLRVERDRAHLAESVRLTVQQALIGPGGLFTFAGRALSGPQSLSGLYARVLALPGVTGAEALAFALNGGRGVRDILHATDRQWLTLNPADLDLRLVEPGLLTRAVAGGVP